MAKPKKTTTPSESIDPGFLVIRNAREHNLKHVSLDLPRRALGVITGISGSGKSSLAFDTIFKEGQRRYLASMSAYARQFMGQMERPAVDLVEGLSPTICIDQKTAGRNPRSTVGTVTEVYDFLRLLYARLGTAHCPNGHGPIQAQNAEGITDHILREYKGDAVLVLAPVIRERKGEYRKELEAIEAKGFLRVRIDGHVHRLDDEASRKSMLLGRYEKHTIEVVIDRLKINEENRTRLDDAVHKALDLSANFDEAKGNPSLVGVCLHDPESETPQPEKETNTSGISKRVRSKMEQQSNRDAAIRFRVFGTDRSCAVCGFTLPELEPRLFSFNVPQGACPDCDGLGQKQEFDAGRMVKDDAQSVFEGALYVLNPEGQVLFMGAGRSEIGKIFKAWRQDVKTPWVKLPAPFRERLFSGKGKEKDGLDFSIIETLEWLYDKYHIGLLERYMHIYPCPTCGGKRLNAVARGVMLRGRSISELSDSPIAYLLGALDHLEFNKTEKPVAEPILREIRERLGFLVDVGLEYLTLSRRANTLSGGEAQRIRLASQVGSGLEGCLYILDEPSIGLHQSDNKKLLRTLGTLRDRGNTVYVIEHDEETMLHADHLVDVGPAAGVHGGEIVFSGTPAELFTKKGLPSTTRAFLTGEQVIPIPATRRQAKGTLTVKGATRNNLKLLDATFPLGVFTCVTGVSGSGKSTLVLDILQQGLSDHFEGRPPTVSLKGIEALDKVIELDQRPIGRTPRSNPATYTGAMDFIRDLFSGVPESRVRGFDKGRFSFNRAGGRCEACGGAGVTVVDMQLFGDAETVCESCDGKRFNAATLDVHFKGKNISEVLEMPCEEARTFFKDIPKLNRLLTILCELGMGYVKLGQPSTTLSGGEAQRIKLSSELGKRATGKTCYILDEPTTGLHFEDIRKLLSALHTLVDQGNTVIVIEHNLDVIKSADFLMEMGPGGGEKGGLIIAEGTPESVAKTSSPTGVELKAHLARQARREKGFYQGAGSGRLLEEFQEEENRHRKAKGPVVPKSTDRPTEPVHAYPEAFAHGRIALRGVTKHNLKHVDLDLPKNRLITLTGLSGSGKTSLAFETLFQEGQRKYIESLSTYARRFLGRIPRAEAEAISGLSPTIAVDQKAGGRNPRSTLATQTEIHDGLRVLWSAIGTFHDPDSGRPLRRHSPTDVADSLIRECPGETLTFYAPLFDPGSKRPTLLDSAERIIPYLSALREKGYTRVESNGVIHRLDEDDLEKKIIPKKVHSFFLVLDRFEIKKSERARILEVAEKAYDLGEGVLWTRTPAGSLRGWARYWADFQSDFHFTDDLTPRHFSFNHHLGACPQCQGIGLARTLSESKFIVAPEESLLRGAIYKNLAPFFTRRGQFYGSLLKRAARHAGIDVWSTPWKDLGRSEKDFLLFGKSPEGAYQVGGKWVWKGVATILEDLFAKSDSERFGPAFAHVIDLALCPTCMGGRLSPALLSVRVGGKAIHEVSRMTVQEAAAFFRALPQSISPRDRELVSEVLDELQFRAEHLLQLGLHYIALDRTMGTLSGGEAQRVRLSTQIGNKLKDVIYILDEPTIGLHERETEQLLVAIKALRDRGNTVVLVEHDARVIAESDWVVDLGPGAGSRGGNISYSGPYDTSAPAMAMSSFHRFLGNPGDTASVWRPRKPADVLRQGPQILMPSITHHNLQGVEVRFPLGSLTGISGVSGSGKSSFMDWFAPRIRELVDKARRVKSAPSDIVCVEKGAVQARLPFVRVEYVDQTPVSSSMRSTAASYIEIWDAIRQLFARTRDAKSRGFDFGAFSFNTPRGRCPACGGAGVLEIEMHFISDVSVTCDTCQGTRYRKEILSVTYKGKNISEVLGLTFAEARQFFDGVDRITRGVQFLLDAGLGYLQLGLNTNHLSGGELQRLKLAKEISAGDQRRDTLYLLDEPTTGLHLADVEMLVGILSRLVDRGNTVVVIEHNKEFLRNCDWLVDLGPEGGTGGGKVVAQGTLEEVRKSRVGHTWKYL